MAENESKLEQKLSRGRPRVVHGGFSFLTKGRLPEHRATLLRHLSACRSEDSASPDTEVLTALKPCLSTVNES